MVNGLSVEIKNFKSILEANIEINKINIVGGVNGSGKSNVSKIFYYFLKANSSKRREYILHEIVDEINTSIDFLDDNWEQDVPTHCSLEDSYSDLSEKLITVKENFDNYYNFAKNKREKLYQEIQTDYEDIVCKLSHEDIDINFSKSLDIGCYKKFLDFKKLIDENYLEDYFKDLFDQIDEYFNLNNHYREEKRLSQIDTLLNDYFIEDDNPVLSKKIMDIIGKNEGFSEFNHQYDKFGLKIDFQVDFMTNERINAFEYFFENGFISDVKYIDNISILDYNEFHNEEVPLYSLELIEDLNLKRDKNLKSILPTDMDDKKSKIESEEIINILNKIENLIKGNFGDFGVFESKIQIQHDTFLNNLIKFNKDSTLGFSESAVSSGIKQLAIIQILLFNNKIKRNSFLIWDEPEVNLHPKWQFELAEILVLLAKELNVTLYINSHSPMFIESIDAFCEFYDMQEDINYYLTEKTQKEFKFNFIKINSDELYKIYDNLGSPYDLINRLRLRKRLDR